jgi:hypothetical protein
MTDEKNLHLDITPAAQRTIAAMQDRVAPVRRRQP